MTIIQTVAFMSKRQDGRLFFQKTNLGPTFPRQTRVESGPDWWNLKDFNTNVRLKMASLYIFLKWLGQNTFPKQLKYIRRAKKGQ